MEYLKLQYVLLDRVKRLATFVRHQLYGEKQNVRFSVPDHCNRRAWPIEVSMDYEITGHQYSVIPNVVDKWRCAQHCIDQSSSCKSANYFRKTKTCSLNSESRRTKPMAFNPSPNQVEYLENECANTLPGIKTIVYRIPYIRFTCGTP